jgi:DNA-binding NtrC family response regulator
MRGNTVMPGCEAQKKAVVVSRDADVLRRLETCLGREGFGVENSFSCDPEEADADDGSTVVIVDLGTPGMNSYARARRARTIWPRAPLYGISDCPSYWRPELKECLGIADVLTLGAFERSCPL